MATGYNKPLYILPYDHRSSFESGLYGWKGTLRAEQTARIAATKQVIYDAFKLALARGVAKENAGILVDEQFGTAILRDAARSGYITAMPAEKSGQTEFQFEYGDQWAAHIEAFKPTFLKVLVRYNPEDDEEMNRRQAARLKLLSDYCHSHGSYYMFELLVPPTHEQTDRLDGDQEAFDNDLRPSLMMESIKELQMSGVEPDVWKIEGLERREDCVQIAETARRDGRKNVGCIILGRGSNDEKVMQWLRNAAGVAGFIGFAVGRTSFWQPLVSLRDGNIEREQAVEQIAQRYMRWVSIFQESAVDRAP